MAFAYKQTIFKKNPTNFSSTHIHLFCYRTKMSSKLNKMSGNENKIAKGEWGRDEATKPIKKLLSEAESLYLEGTLSQLLLPSIV